MDHVELDLHDLDAVLEVVAGVVDALGGLLEDLDEQGGVEGGQDVQIDLSNEDHHGMVVELGVLNGG